jgi:hypothetical protein
LKQSIDQLTTNTALRERLRSAGRATVVGDGTFTFAAYVARLASELRLPVPDTGFHHVADGLDVTPELSESHR